MGCLKLPCRCEADLDPPQVDEILNAIAYFSHYYATGEDMLCDFCRKDPSHGMEKNKKYHLLDDEAYVDRIEHFEEVERQYSKYIKLGFERLDYTGEYNLMPGAFFNENPNKLKMNSAYGKIERENYQ